MKRAAPVESRGGPINYSDADWADLVPRSTSEASPLTAERGVLVRGGCCGQAGVMAETVTVNDVLDGHVGLER